MNTADDKVQVSFEFFPPNSEKMNQTLWASIERLAVLEPRFVSVTYGADGSTRERTHAAVERIADQTSLTAAPHLTCIGADRAEIDAYVNALARKYPDTDASLQDFLPLDAEPAAILFRLDPPSAP